MAILTVIHIFFFSDSISDGIAVDYINQLLFYTCTYDKVIVVVSLKNRNIYRTIVNESLDQPRDIIVHPERGLVTLNIVCYCIIFMYSI